MKKEVRTVVYDEDVAVEAYALTGITQPFPNHLHSHYVIGFVEAGERILSCKHTDYRLTKGSIILFNPGDNHACAQSAGGTFTYGGLTISQAVMIKAAEEITGCKEHPGFSETVIHDEEIYSILKKFHTMLMAGTASSWEKEEAFLDLLTACIQTYGQPFLRCMPECRQEIEKACEFIRCHLAERICLDQLCRHTGLSKSALLRAFTEAKGVTPYRYVESLRIHKAKQLLEAGVSPRDAAIQTGFADQSHFTNYFSRFIGLSPGVYRHMFSTSKKGRR